jgi:transposase
MDRSAIKSLRRKGKTIKDISETMGINRKTVMAVLRGPTEVKPQTRDRDNLVEEYADSIRDWIKKGVPVKRMLELVLEASPPYRGGRSEFYRQVAKIRRELKLEAQEVFVQFKGLAGEYCQVDWGEVRGMQFVRQEAGTRYYFCARLKFSGMSFVKFTTDMRLETLLRCLIEAWETFGGVPWVCVFDNMKTVTTGRDENHQPIWNKTFLKLMFEVESHPLACWPQSGNQKGSVESLVKWVQSNFLQERCFWDDADLDRQNRIWLDKGNNSVSQAHGEIPSVVWQNHERNKLIPLSTTSADYGLATEVQVGTESLIHIDRNRYSVPVGYIGRPLLARVRRDWIDFYSEEKLVAHHCRAKCKEFKPIRVPEHYEPVFKKKPRAQVMLYRDHLMAVDKSIASYIETLCFRERAGFGPHILRMYELLTAYGATELGAACAIASEHGAYGASYLDRLIQRPHQVMPFATLQVAGPSQEEVDRGLAHYQDFVQESRV